MVEPGEDGQVAKLESETPSSSVRGALGAAEGMMMSAGRLGRNPR